MCTHIQSILYSWVIQNLIENIGFTVTTNKSPEAYCSFLCLQQQWTDGKRTKTELYE